MSRILFSWSSLKAQSVAGLLLATSVTKTSSHHHHHLHHHHFHHHHHHQQICCCPPKANLRGRGNLISEVNALSLLHWLPDILRVREVRCGEGEKTGPLSLIHSCCTWLSYFSRHFHFLDKKQPSAVDFFFKLWEIFKNKDKKRDEHI